jgi:hypothetical protein
LPTTRPADPHRRRGSIMRFAAGRNWTPPFHHACTPVSIFGRAFCDPGLDQRVTVRNRYAPDRPFRKKPPVMPTPPADSACSIQQQPIGHFLYLRPRRFQPSPAIVVAGQFPIIEPAAVLADVRRIGCDRLVPRGRMLGYHSTMASITGRRRRGSSESAWIRRSSPRGVGNATDANCLRAVPYIAARVLINGSAIKAVFVVTVYSSPGRHESVPGSPSNQYHRMTPECRARSHLPARGTWQDYRSFVVRFFDLMAHHRISISSRWNLQLTTECSSGSGW